MVAFGGVASARVMMIPPVARACSEEQTWDDVATCAAKFGAVKIERTLPHARLVRITNANAGDRGIYLFVESHKAWRLGGMYEAPVEVLGLDTVSIGTAASTASSIGISEHEDVALDDDDHVHAVSLRHEQMLLRRRRLSLLDGDDVVRRARSPARRAGRFAARSAGKSGSLLVTGDRSRAGAASASSAR